MANDLAARSMAELDSDSLDSPHTPSSPTKKKFSFKLKPSPPMARRNFSTEAASIPDIQVGRGSGAVAWCVESALTPRGWDEPGVLGVWGCVQTALFVIMQFGNIFLHNFLSPTDTYSYNAKVELPSPKMQVIALSMFKLGNPN